MKAEVVARSYRSIVTIPTQGVNLEAELTLPKGSTSLVVFAHGSGSSRHSPRNKFVANVLNEAKIGTLLVDLLSEEEDSYFSARFDIGLLVNRLKLITNWIEENGHTNKLKLGYFGASTGAAAAVIAAVESNYKVSAVVCRGGRVDLAYNMDTELKSPTLLIVGEDDYSVLEINQIFFENMKCKKDIAIVPRASHLFEEPGALDVVASLASKWFKKYLK